MTVKNFNFLFCLNLAAFSILEEYVKIGQELLMTSEGHILITWIGKNFTLEEGN
jgi:hypothetical protein